MRKVSAAVVTLFALLLGLGQLSEAGPLVGANPERLITIVKQVEGTAPDSVDAWEFTITSQNCGESIFIDQVPVDGGIVTIPAAGGQIDVEVLPSPPGPGRGAIVPCLYTVSETTVAGWTTDPDPAEYADVTSPTTLNFTNTAVVATTTTTTTTTTAPVTTTAVSTTTIVAVGAGELPFTGSRSSGFVVFIGSALLALGAVAVVAARQAKHKG